MTDDDLIADSPKKISPWLFHLWVLAFILPPLLLGAILGFLL